MAEDEIKQYEVNRNEGKKIEIKTNKQGVISVVT